MHKFFINEGFVLNGDDGDGNGYIFEDEIEGGEGDDINNDDIVEIEDG